MERPQDLVAVGRVADAWGIRGGIKVVPFSEHADALLHVRQWWLEQDGQWRDVEVLAAKVHVAVVTANLVGWVDRQAALALKGSQIWVARSRFPQLPDDEFYWVDLIGLLVVGEDLVPVGRVSGLMDNGAHQILEVEREVNGKKVVELVPFVDRHVKTVDRAIGHVVVDWQWDE